LIYDAHEFEAGRQFGSERIPKILQSAWTLPERMFIRRAAAVITVSEAISNALARRYSIPPAVVVRNVPIWTGPVKSSLLRERLQVASDHPILLYQGWMVRGRGLEQAIRSLEFLRSATLVMIGTGRLQPELEKLARDVNVADRVHFLGRLRPSELPPYTASADIGLHLLQNTCLNHDYAMPNKLFEYMHAGLPMVVGNTSEMKRVVERENVGISVNPDSPQEIAEAVNSIWSRADRYVRMRANGVTAAKARYNWQIESQNLLGVYTSVLGKS
jgi:glycosyltransferase involved in cell wall biosynthesis